MQHRPATKLAKSIEDRESDLKQWINQISESNPDLKGFSICPFAKNHTYKIVHSSVYDIKPLDEEFGVVIFVIEDNIDLEIARNRIEELNQEYPKYKFFDDFRDEPSHIGLVQTNNNMYNLILYQNSQFLSHLRQKLAKTAYYDTWDDDYLQKILEEDYEMVQKLRNKQLVCELSALEQFSMGKHLLLEVYDVKFDLLNDEKSLLETMKQGINRAKMTILNIYPHKFEPQGCTIVIALSESHVSCHSWPEEGCIAIDVYTCGEGNPKLIALELLKYLNSYNYRLREVNR